MYLETCEIYFSVRESISKFYILLQNSCGFFNIFKVSAQFTCFKQNSILIASKTVITSAGGFEKDFNV